MKVVIVKMVKMMNCHVWQVKVKETVSDEAREDQWGVRSVDRSAAYRKERFVIFRGAGRWASKSDQRWRTCVVTRLNRNLVVEILRLVCCEPSADSTSKRVPGVLESFCLFKISQHRPLANTYKTDRQTCTVWVKKVAPPKTFCNIFTQARYIYVKFCGFVASLYPHITTDLT